VDDTGAEFTLGAGGGWDIDGDANRNYGHGLRALDSLTSGTDNIAIGEDAGTAVTSSNYNILIGNNAGDTITSGAGWNIAIGENAADNLVGGAGNIAIGKDTQITTGSLNYGIAIGHLAHAASDNSAIAIGGGTTKTYAEGISIGSKAETWNPESIAIGHNALDNSSTGALRNVAIGTDAGGSNNTGDDNVYLGYQAGDTHTTNGSVFIGYSSGPYSAGNIGAVAIGDNATADMFGVTIGGGDILCHGICIGYDTQSAGDQSVIIGTDAFQNANTTEDHSVVVGDAAMFSATSGIGNVVIGSGAAFDVTTGSHNLFIGRSAGDNITSGQFNIAIGSYADFTANGSDQIVIMNDDDASAGRDTVPILEGFMSARSDADFSGNSLTLTGPSAFPAAAINQDGGDLILRGGQNATGGGTDGFALVNDTIYGIMSVQGGVTSQDNIGTTPEILVAWNTDGIANGTTPDETNDYITANVAGVYSVNVSLSFFGSNGSEVGLYIYTYDDSGTAWNDSGFAIERTLSSGTAIGAISINGLVTLDTSDRVAVYITTDGPTDDVTVGEAQLMIERISD
jgi:hypothetical protein